jgi:hypothetical protein
MPTKHIGAVYLADIAYFNIAVQKMYRGTLASDERKFKVIEVEVSGLLSGTRSCEVQQPYCANPPVFDRLKGTVTRTTRSRTVRAICLTKAWVPSLPQLSSLNKVPMVPGHLFQNHDSTTRLLYGSYGIAFEKHANLRSSFISTIR